MVHEFQGQARVSGGQRIARLHRYFVPPALGMVAGQGGRLHAQQHGVGLRILAIGAQGPGPVIEQGGVGRTRNFRQCRPGMGETRRERDARLRQRRGLGVHPRHLPPCRCYFVAPQQRVQPRLVGFRGQIGRVPLHDSGFRRLVETAIAPALTDQRAAARGVAAGCQRLAQPDLANGGNGRALPEPLDDLGRRHLRRNIGLGAGIERIAQGPVRRHLQRRVDICESGAAVFIQRITPLQQLARHRVLALIAKGDRVHPVGPGRCRESAGENIVIGRREDMDVAGPGHRHARIAFGRRHRRPRGRPLDAPGRCQAADEENDKDDADMLQSHGRRAC